MNTVFGPWTWTPFVVENVLESWPFSCRYNGSIESTLRASSLVYVHECVMASKRSGNGVSL